MDHVTPKDLFVGNILNLFARQIKIVDFADQFTRSSLQTTTQKTFAMIKPDCFSNAGKIVSMIEQSGLTIISMCMHQMSMAEAQEFYGEHKGKPFYEGLVQFICSGTVIGLELMGKDAVAAWRTLLGPTNCYAARTSHPDSVRAKFGTEGVRNAAHGSDSVTSAERELTLFFKKFDRNRNCFNIQPAREIAKENRSNGTSNSIFGVNSTKGVLGGQGSQGTQGMTKSGVTSRTNNVACIVIKPHLLKEGRAGECLQHVIERCRDTGLTVSAIEMFTLNKDEVEEFMEVYKGVLPEYGLMVEEMKAGSMLAIMVQGDGLVVQTVRKMCGPHDPQVARALRGGSLRAIFGADKVRNGVHCTDLEDDGILECEFFFSVMQKVT